MSGSLAHPAGEAAAACPWCVCPVLQSSQTAGSASANRFQNGMVGLSLHIERMARSSPCQFWGDCITNTAEVLDRRGVCEQADLSGGVRFMREVADSVSRSLSLYCQKAPLCLQDRDFLSDRARGIGPLCLSSESRATGKGESGRGNGPFG